MRVAAVIVARNEEGNIGGTLQSILAQTQQIQRIVVVDDGSWDSTGAIARRLGINVVELPPHKESYIGRPELAERWNVGLAVAVEEKPTHIMTLGADHVLPPTYLELVLSHMDGVAVACGRYPGQPIKGEPHGSGRVVDASWWCKLNRCHYPVNYGWESWLVHRARAEGRGAVVVDAPIGEVRPISMSRAKADAQGRGMWCLGLGASAALRRAFNLGTTNPINGLSLLTGYFSHQGCRRYSE